MPGALIFFLFALVVFWGARRLFDDPPKPPIKPVPPRDDHGRFVKRKPWP